MLRRAVSRDEVSEGRLVILLVLFLVRRLVLSSSPSSLALATTTMASAYHQGATLPGPPAGGARSRTRRARRATGGEERDGVRGGFEGRRGIGSGGGWGVVSRGRVAGCAVASVAAPIDERDARASLSGVEDAATRREDVALLRTLGRTRARRARRARARPLGEDLRGVRGRRGRCQSERRGAARRRRACRGFRWRETVVRSTPAVVRRDGAHRAGRRRVRGRAARTPRGRAP